MPTKIIDCPDCFQKCAWCSAYRWMVREGGCMNQVGHGGKCAKGKEDKGTICPDCRGEKKMDMTFEITPRAHPNVVKMNKAPD